MQLNELDYASWVFDIYGTLPGDANLDYVVDGRDLLIWNAHRSQSEFHWTRGDFNFDGAVDGDDLVIWNNHKFTSAIPPALPEPTGWLTAVCAVFMALARLRSTTRRDVD